MTTRKQAKEGMKIAGHIIAELFKPGTDILVAREEGDNIICAGGANAISTALNTGTLTQFPYMVISDDTGAVARATAAIAGNRAISTSITPTVDNSGVTSKATWVFTFTASGSTGRDVIKKFGMESNTPSGGVLWNEYLFTVVKDNKNNDLKITYVVSIAP